MTVYTSDIIAAVVDAYGEESGADIAAIING